MADLAPAQHMEHVVRTYIQACNDADADAIAECFCAEAVQYFPSPRAKWSGASTTAIVLRREPGRTGCAIARPTLEGMGGA